MNIQKLIKPLKFTYVNSNITDSNFPDDGRRGKELKIFKFTDYWTTEQGIEKMKSEGYRPATVHELLLWLEKNWNGLDWIVALGSIYRGRVVCADGSTVGRDLGLGSTGGRWRSDYFLLGVAEYPSEALNSSTLKLSDTLPLELIINNIKYRRVDTNK